MFQICLFQNHARTVQTKTNKTESFSVSTMQKDLHNSKNCTIQRNQQENRFGLSGDHWTEIMFLFLSACLVFRIAHLYLFLFPSPFYIVKKAFQKFNVALPAWWIFLEFINSSVSAYVAIHGTDWTERFCPIQWRRRETGPGKREIRFPHR